MTNCKITKPFCFSMLLSNKCTLNVQRWGSLRGVQLCEPPGTPALDHYQHAITSAKCLETACSLVFFSLYKVFFLILLNAISIFIAQLMKGIFL